LPHFKLITLYAAPALALFGLILGITYTYNSKVEIAFSHYFLLSLHLLLLFWYPLCMSGINLGSNILLFYVMCITCRL